MCVCVCLLAYIGSLLLNTTPPRSLIPRGGGFLFVCCKQESVCTGSYFKPNGFRALVMNAVDQFISAKMPESANQVCPMAKWEGRGNQKEGQGVKALCCI